MFEPIVLRNVSFTILPGETVAITGPSGAGKTTLAKLMLGLLTPTSGEIMINDIPLQRFGIERLRGAVGTVMQDDSLFSGTIEDNICFFDPLPDRNLVREVAKAAAIDAEIMAMPMGYNTLLVGSVSLSGGQRQRVLLARALYKRPAILVLDEATSQLDSEHESAVNGEILRLNVTRIIIAHRQETLDLADRVIRIQSGTVHSIRLASRHDSNRYRGHLAGRDGDDASAKANSDLT
jgi:ATP-binding cassette subfamily B protein RaxB